MASRKNFSIKSRKIKEGAYENFDSSSSYDPMQEQDLNYEEWVKFMSYYRYYIDRFATDILQCNVFPFQKLILRSMGRYQNNMLICCRGKTFAPSYSNVRIKN